MKITEVRIFPTESKDGKLKAFVAITFDDWFVVRNVKIIQGSNGFFVAMPSRKAMYPCPKCTFKNGVGSKYCNQCGGQIEQRHISGEEGSENRGSHMDIAHPITQECRIYIQDTILSEYGKGNSGQKQEKIFTDTSNSDVEIDGNVVETSEKEAASREETAEPKEETRMVIEEAKDIEL